MWLSALPEVGDVNLSPLGCQVPTLVVTFRMSLVLFAEHIRENDEGAYHIQCYMDRRNVAK